jgi:hypothetical protein
VEVFQGELGAHEHIKLILQPRMVGKKCLHLELLLRAQFIIHIQDKELFVVAEVDHIVLFR